MAEATLQLSPTHLGFIRGHSNPPGSLEDCNRLLQKNHEVYHMFFREIAGMNHISHSLLTCFALGAGPKELQDRYDDEAAGQRPMPPVDNELLENLSDADIFYQTMHTKVQYNTFLHFFERRIAAHGWKAVVHEFIFSRTKVAERMFSSLFDGLYHPLIHLGLGIEFELPGLVAEALAQAAANDDSDLHRLFGMCEAESEAVYSTEVKENKRLPSILELLDTIRSIDEIRTAPRWSDLGLKLRNGVVGRAGSAFARVAGRFKVAADEDELARRTAEMISTCAYMCGAAQFQGRKTKIDFFWMHAVTSSIFMSVLAQQGDWISLEDRVRLLERKVYTDFAWYVASGSVPLDAAYITEYSSPESDGWSWDDVFGAVVKEHDDGHAAKFIRALKNGEQVSARYEAGEWAEYFPTKGDMWLKLARMCHDTTKSMLIDLKWVRFTGYDEAWQRPDLASPN
ncbi:Oxidoreductase AflY [Cytospora mali]|uniref:Oxidoreductase AflY n=1 Tax=Cytospora mali TaxID=578113 RepID=A0A194VYD4_CYTMA|nr:Oxidoreductase AflY [Valsa mali]